MIKSKLRDKVLKLRKSKSKKLINVNPSNIYSYLKKKNYNLKIIGGYYPSNYEINDLEILDYLLCPDLQKDLSDQVAKKFHPHLQRFFPPNNQN